ncbi:hypothetical protein SDC9_116693 [bioreactor metagenome]|uniref:Uncharacterized protein n=1 Tax=bioreactor metagenome TaxID=1076179 RepID=A0A645BWX3_9ZZZZ
MREQKTLITSGIIEFLKIIQMYNLEKVELVHSQMVNLQRE